MRRSVGIDPGRDPVPNFCAPGGRVDSLGLDYRPDRKPIEPLSRMLPPCARPVCR